MKLGNMFFWVCFRPHFGQLINRIQQPTYTTNDDAALRGWLHSEQVKISVCYGREVLLMKSQNLTLAVRLVVNLTN